MPGQRMLDDGILTWSGEMTAKDAGDRGIFFHWLDEILQPAGIEGRSVLSEEDTILASCPRHTQVAGLPVVELTRWNGNQGDAVSRGNL